MHIYLDVFQEAVILSPIRRNFFTTVLYLVIDETKNKMDHKPT